MDMKLLEKRIAKRKADKLKGSSQEGINMYRNFAEELRGLETEAFAQAALIGSVIQKRIELLKLEVSQILQKFNSLTTVVSF